MLGNDMPVRQVQDRIVENLFNRISRDGGRESAALNTLHKDFHKEIKKNFLKAAAEDLRDKGLLRMDSNSRYHLTAKGIEFAQTPPDSEGLNSKDDKIGILPIESSAWTGLPTDFELSEASRVDLVKLLNKAEADLETLGAGNHEKAMARAYIVAARALAEAPEPQSDLIWQMISRAADIAQVAGLFIAIIALFQVAAR